MANEISECKELCRKYTMLRDEEMEEIFPFLSELQSMAEKEQANVYIDCMTYTGKSMVIVGEAFPESKGTIYTEPLFGKIMYTKNEPAVARTFSTGIPTKNVTGEEVISSRVMVQQVYPIKHNGKTIAVLIYEKLFDKPEHEDVQHKTARESSLGAHIRDIEKIVDSFSQGVILVDKDDNICYYNEYVEGVFSELGYVGQILGMEIHNILGDDSSDGRYRFQMRGYTLEGRMIPLEESDVEYAVILEDITQMERLMDSNRDLEFRMHEERHSVKNGLLFLREFADTKAKDAETQEEKAAYMQMYDRVGMFLSITELKLQTGGSIGVKHGLEYVFLGKMDLVTADKDIQISITGDDVTVGDETFNSIISVVYELICNSVKHAFSGRDQGRISIDIKKGVVTSSITYTDNGSGFDPEEAFGKSHGLTIIKTIVADKLSGVLKIDSGEGGTKVSFDFME